MLKRLLILFAIVTCLTACHARRAALPATEETALPASGIAEKYAHLLGVDQSAIQNGRLYAFIDLWMGTPYRFGGMDHGGVDCSGFTCMLEQEVYGLQIPRTTGEQVTAIQRKYEGELKEGDLVFFDYGARPFSHVGVYLQNGYYVHASTTKGVIINRLHDPFVYRYFSRCGSIPARQDTLAGK